MKSFVLYINLEKCIYVESVRFARLSPMSSSTYINKIILFNNILREIFFSKFFLFVDIKSCPSLFLCQLDLFYT